ncbi:B-cell receptor CD22-like isoform X2 [Sardina pilchardus]|uniref:B-cell receptor CD22-like isoform X2 n=1 Tax=Sardina pilchardus TaxID=27697 RepID=UPI002E0E0CED
MMSWLASLALVILLTTQDVFGEHLNVTYKPESACGFVGSSVNMSCSFTHPGNLTIKQIYWTNEKYQDPPDLTGDPDFSGRVIVERQQGTNISNLFIKQIRMLANHSRYYYCSIIFTNGHKWTGDPGVYLQVLAPQTPSVSISPPGEILEGTTVTLICNNKSDLRVLSYSWFKMKKFLGTGHSYTIKNFTTGDSGEYSCKLTYDCGFKYSAKECLHLFYPPRNTSMLPAQSTVVAKGNRMTLTCESDANPPVESFTWFKVNESTPIGSGKQYNITNTGTENGGQFYCVARNKYGAGNSTAVSITVEGASPGLRDRGSVLSAVGAVVICGLVALICVVVWMRIMKRKLKPEQQYSSVNVQGRHGAEDDGQYCNVNLQRSDQSRVNEAAGGAEDSGHYATIRQTAAAQGEDDVQYASVQFQKAMAAGSSPVQPEGEPSPIYSSVEGCQDTSVVYSGVQPRGV